MKTIVTLAFLASVALNVSFFAGCRSLHDAFYGNPCKYGPVHAQPVNDGGKAELECIAEMLDIKTSGKTVSDLSSDIRYKLDRRVDVPSTFDAAAFEKMSKDLRVEEKKAMCEYQNFISDLQGKTVIVIEPEE